MNDIESLFDDANSHLAVGELEEAAALYRRCTELDPAFVDGWHALGMALMKLGHHTEAISATLRALELDINNVMLWTSLSQAYVRNNQIKEAEAAGAKSKVLSWGGKIKPEVLAEFTQPALTVPQEPQPPTPTAAEQ